MGLNGGNSNQNGEGREGRKQYLSSVEIPSCVQEDWKAFFQSTFYEQLPRNVQNTLVQVEKTLVINFPQFFTPCKTETSKCTNVFDNTIYYKCSDCQLYENSCICVECFDPQKHQGHHYYTERGSGACDCGFSQRWSSATFCGNHCGSSSRTLRKLQKKQRKQFQSYFKGCFSLYFSLISLSQFKIKKSRKVMESYEKGLFNELQRLVQNSECFIYSLTKILEEVYICPFQQSTQKTLLLFLVQNRKTECTAITDTLYYMIPNRTFVKNFFRTLFQSSLTVKEINDRKALKKFLDFVFDQYELFNELAEQQVVFKNQQKNGDYQGINTFYLPLIENSKRIQKEKKSRLNSVWKQLWENGILQKHLYKAKHLFLILTDMQGDEKLFQNVMIFLINNSKGFLQSMTCQQKSMEFLIDLVKGLVMLKSSNIKFETPDNIYEFLLAKYAHFCINNPKKMHIVVLRLLVENVSTSLVQQALNSCWKEQNLSCEQVVGFTAEIIRNYIGNPLHYQSMLTEFITDPNEFQQNQRRKQKLFLEFLCSKKTVGLASISEMRKDNLLDFPQAENILNSITYFNHREKIFIYKGSEENYNPGFYLKKILDLQELPQIKFRGNEIKHTSGLERFFIRLFNDEYCNFYINAKLPEVKSIKYIKNRFGYVMALNFVVIDQVTQGKIEKVREQLLKWEQNEQERKKLNPLEGMEVDYLFPLQKKDNIKDLELKQKTLTEKQQKNREKKLKRFSQKTKRILQTIKFQQEGKDIQCLVCKDKNLPGNKIHYLAYLQKSHFVDKIFNSNLVGNIFIHTCFHTIHKSCFLSLLKNSGKNQSLYCPLCSTPVNCVIPIQFEASSWNSTKFNQFWKNRIIQLFTNQYDEYDIEELEILIMRNLILRLGIMKVLKSRLVTQNQRATKYFQECIKFYCKNQDIKEQILNKIKQFKQILSEKELMSSKIEILVLQNIQKRVIEGEQDFQYSKDIVNYLSSNMIPKEFQILRQSLEIRKQQQIIQENTAKKHLLYSQPPQNAADLIKLRKICSKKHTNDRYCLICNTIFCQDCTGMDKHSQQFHQSLSFCVNLNNGNLKIKSVAGSYTYKLYRNKFYEQWQENKKPQKFCLDRKLFNDSAEYLFLRQGPKQQ